MQQLLLVIHVIVSVVLIGLVLMQQGKGADIGSSFGSGASQTIFGSQGSGSFLVKVTAALAVMFFATTLLLGYVSARQVKQQEILKLPEPVTTQVPINKNQ